jgi:hypothetical protein
MHCAPVDDVEIDGTGSNEPIDDLVVIIPGAEGDVGEGVGSLTIIVVVEDGPAELQIASPAVPCN